MNPVEVWTVRRDILSDVLWLIKDRRTPQECYSLVDGLLKRAEAKVEELAKEARRVQPK